MSYNDIDDYLEGKTVSSEGKDVIEKHYIKTAHKRELAYTRYSWPKN